jgi:hypothetical protein
METIEYRDPQNGRLYEAMQDGDSMMIVGPPEGLVDAMNLPEPFATNLHNVLYRRRIFALKDITGNNRALLGALQEALNVDAQRLTEAFFNYEKEEVVP